MVPSTHGRSCLSSKWRRTLLFSKSYLSIWPWIRIRKCSTNRDHRVNHFQWSTQNIRISQEFKSRYDEWSHQITERLSLSRVTNRNQVKVRKVNTTFSLLYQTDGQGISDSPVVYSHSPREFVNTHRLQQQLNTTQISTQIFQRHTRTLVNTGTRYMENRYLPWTRLTDTSSVTCALRHCQFHLVSQSWAVQTTYPQIDYKISAQGFLWRSHGIRYLIPLMGHNSPGPFGIQCEIEPHLYSIRVTAREYLMARVPLWDMTALDAKAIHHDSGTWWVRSKTLHRAQLSRTTRCTPMGSSSKLPSLARLVRS